MLNKLPEQTADICGHSLSDKAFAGFQALIFKEAGITMSESKRSLIAGRLAKRLRLLDIKSYDNYLHYITKGEGARNAELQKFVDLLTTNETYFFREPQHFDYIRKNILAKHNPEKPFRAWSAASSSGEEAYTLAMVIADTFGTRGNWEIVGTDISTEMIKAARQAIYSEHKARMVPKEFRHKYLLRGDEHHKGLVAVVPEIKRHVKFEHYNLVDSPARKEQFDIILCRNVLIYFSQPTKIKVLMRICDQLKNGAYLMTGHSESLHGLMPDMSSVRPSIYIKSTSNRSLYEQAY